MNDLSADKLHPNLEEFKLFMNTHPEVVLELRKSGNSLQDYYNKWIEYGEDDPIWGFDNKRDQEKDIEYGELFNQIIKYTENIDINKVQGHVEKFTKILNVVQLMLGDFISQKDTNVNSKKQADLFSLFRD